MALIALKVDVDTLRGTREGVPRLLRVLDQHGVQATFLFSLGPDHTGWALRRVFRPGFFGKVARTSVVAHYGLRTLLYGVLLPAPDIGRRAVAEMRAARDAGHPCGIHTWDHVVWQDRVRNADEAWTRRQMQRAHARYVEVFGTAPETHGAAGWQMNAAALRQIDTWGMRYASDGRGAAPFVPVVDGRRLAHLQIPTTLPTLDELIGRDGVTVQNVAGALLRQTGRQDADQVYTLHAELEGGRLASVFDDLLSGWKAQGHQLAGLDTAAARLDARTLPGQALRFGSVAGRSGELFAVPPPVVATSGSRIG